MKESKKNHDINQAELDINTEKRFNEELNEIKEKLNSEKLSDEFKENLQAKLQEELNKTDTHSKGKIIKFPTFTRKLAGICACFVFLCSGCLAFADDIENVIFNIFNNTDRIVEKAIAEGNYREINMEYVEDNGVSIKVDYVAFDDDNLYIAFNVLGEECDKVFFNDISIKSQDEFSLYTRNAVDNNSKLIAEDICVDSKNAIVIYKLTDIQYDLDKLKMLNIEIKNINFIKEKNDINKSGVWKIKFDI